MEKNPARTVIDPCGGAGGAPRRPPAERACPEASGATMAQRMNQKDRNLFKGIGLLALPVLALSVLMNYSLALAGDPLRLCGAFALFYGLFVVVKRAARSAAPSADLRAMGTWAIVTGCTGGLGEKFCEGLARRGLNLLLISRNPKKLAALKERLGKEFGVACEVLAFDFASATKEEELAFFDDALPAKLAGAPIAGDVALLVNNVGVGDEAPFYAEEIRMDEAADMIKVNCGAVVNMSKGVLPLLRLRGRGAVINVSSGSCAQPCPMLAAYSATKAFIEQYSVSCAREYRQHGVDVLCIRPYYISGTGLYPAKRATLNAPHADVVVEGALRGVGRYEVTHAYWFHGVMAFMLGGVFEDPFFGMVAAACAGALKLNGSMLMIQQSARRRVERKKPEIFAGAKSAKAAYEAKLGF